MDFVWKLYGNTYAVHVTVALVGVATLNLALPAPPPSADIAISKRPLLFTVWTQLRLRSHQILYEIFTHKQFLPTSVGNAQAQLHFCG